MSNFLKKIVFMSLFFTFTVSVSGVDKFKPFILASTNADTVQKNIGVVKGKLKSQEIEIVGEYAPYENAYIIVISSDTLKSNASQTKYGGFGAMIRISITKVGNDVQISYNNPFYMRYVYQLKQNPTAISNKLKNSLGWNQEFGSEKSYSADELKSYHYKFLMPYFDDVVELASFDSHTEAVKNVESGLDNNSEGVKKVYKINIPSKKSVVFGVSMAKDSASDKYIMGEIDFKKIKSTSHLPYEILIIDDEAFILPAEFRIAINFPELSMMGANSFMNIMAAPEDIKNTLKNSISKE